MKRAKRDPLKTEKVLTVEQLTKAGLRFLVANYYQSQAMRKRSDMQFRHLGDRMEAMSPEIVDLLTITNKAFVHAEDYVEKSLAKVVKTDPVARWLLAQRGISHIITAGLLAHIDIERAPTAGHIWSFAGLNPDMKWGAGEKRPYNAELKQICWHAGNCFMRQSNDPDCFYGRLYRERKQFEIKRNEMGGNAERAKTFKVSDGATKEVKAKLALGQMPDFNIDARARRYAVKLFLSHLHAIMYWDRYKKAPPKPFALSILGHAHEIRIPHADLFPGFEGAYYGAAMMEAALERIEYPENAVANE